MYFELIELRAGLIELRPIRSGKRGMHVPSLARSPRTLQVAAPQVEAQLISEQRESHLINGGAEPFGHWHADGRKMGDARAKSGLSSFSHVPNQIGRDAVPLRLSMWILPFRSIARRTCLRSNRAMRPSHCTGISPLR